MMFLAIILLFIICLFMKCSSNAKKDSISDAFGQISASVKNSAPPSEEEMQNYINDHSELYPDYLIEFSQKYPQTLEFVYYYPEKKDATPSNDLEITQSDNTIPLFIQWDDRWGYIPMGSQIIGTAGCGPTCLSMIYTGLTGNTDLPPDKACAYAVNNGYFIDNSGTTWDFMTEGAAAFGLHTEPVILDENAVKSELQNGHPLILNMSKGIFTQSGHYIVLAGLQDDKYIINDPNSPEHSEKLWTWDEFSDQINMLWAFSLE